MAEYESDGSLSMGLIEYSDGNIAYKISSKGMLKSGTMKIVFSSLYAEDPNYLDTYISNFLLFSNLEDILVINLSTSIDPQYKPPNRVFIHYGSTKRYQYGATLLQGHIENFQLAKSLIDGDFHFCTMASNALFFRRYDKSLLNSMLNVKHNRRLINKREYGVKSDWWWPKISKIDEFNDLFPDGLSTNSIEGLLSTNKCWEKIEAYSAQLLKISEKETQQTLFPFEEVVPGTVITGLKENYIHIAKVFFSRFASGNQFTTLDDILNPEVPQNICAYKWFKRSADNFRTQMLANQKLLNAINHIHDLNGVEHKSFAMLELADYFLRKDKFSSFPSSQINFQKEFLCDVTSSRKIINLDENHDIGFIFFEEISNEDKFSIKAVIEKSELKIKSEGKDDSSKFVAIIYLKIPNSSKEIQIHGNFKNFDTYFSDRKKYVKNLGENRIHGISFGNAIAISPPFTSESSVYFGVPVYPGHETSFRILLKD